MGGAGSGGYKNSPGDIETHSAWILIDPLPGTPQKLRQARCKYCTKEMAQHTSRQRAHLFTCQSYLDAMKSQGIENTITQRAADPTTFTSKMPKIQQADGTEKRKANQKITDYSIAVRIQALALAEASISYDRISEITGIDAKLLDKLRKSARERGYDPTISMQLKEEYVVEPVKPGPGRPKKSRLDELSTNTLGQATTSGDPRAALPAAYVQTDSSALPPGNWNFLSATQVHSASALG